LGGNKFLNSPIVIGVTPEAAEAHWQIEPLSTDVNNITMNGIWAYDIATVRVSEVGHRRAPD
jgi:hypothetical protein